MSEITATKTYFTKILHKILGVYVTKRVIFSVYIVEGYKIVPAKITILYRKLKISEIQMTKQKGIVRLGFNCGIPYVFSFVFSIEPRYCKDMKNMLK